MSGWDSKSGKIKNSQLSEEQIWRYFNVLFSDRSKKRTSYKFGLLKSILDNLFNVVSDEYFISYHALFSRFAENYWNLVCKYSIRQMWSDGKSDYSKIETIIKSYVSRPDVPNNIDFESLDAQDRAEIIKKVIAECRKYVIRALKMDFEENFYAFSLSGSGVILNPSIYGFLIKYKHEIEMMNYYAWAKFLDGVNNEELAVHLLTRLELATSRRKDLSVYQRILLTEFEQDTCFYCGKPLKKTTMHVDHFVPWSFIKDDKIWNFVLSCPKCNERKSNKLVSSDLYKRIEERNRRFVAKSELSKSEFDQYEDGILSRIRSYAWKSGYLEVELENEDRQSA